jgi:hypothetical protein
MAEGYPDTKWRRKLLIPGTIRNIQMNQAVKGSIYRVDRI